MEFCLRLNLDPDAFDPDSNRLIAVKPVKGVASRLHSLHSDLREKFIRCFKVGRHMGVEANFLLWQNHHVFHRSAPTKSVD